MEFAFGLPGQSIFGTGSSKKLSEIITSFGGKTVFCVYDKGVKKAGIVDGLLKMMKADGLKVIEYDGVVPNPTDTNVEEAANIARKADVDVVVAIGGGSAMDCAKAMNIILTNPGSIQDYEGLGMVKNPAKPLIAVPTTAGTASEVTGFTIITDTKRLKKMVIGGQHVGATVALLDPELTMSLPASITASTGMDALTHAIEAYVSKGASVPSDINALKAISLISRSIVEATENGKNADARSNMLLGSMLAGYAFNSAVLGLVHSIAHPLSVHCGLAHGDANAAVLPYVMEFNTKVVPEKTYDIGIAMGICKAGMKAEEGAKLAVEAVKKLLKQLRIKTLQEAGVKREQFERIAEDALNEISTLFTPREASKNEIVDILNLAYRS
jgi:alcohol dehydrogenase